MKRRLNFLSALEQVSRVLAEREAWLKYSLPSRIGLSGAAVGGAPFPHGDLWDLGADGRTLAIVKGQIFIGERRRGGAIRRVRL